MSTPNFKYKNRCIVVSDDDFDDGNYPEFDGVHEINGNRNYPSHELKDQPDCRTVVAILTGAYYSGACIDYQETEYQYEDDGLTEAEYEALKEKEEDVMNAFLDKLRDDWGFTEVVCTAIFSNGEAIYNKIWP
jgi:hypothetical protein